jgi:acyl carrier protein
MHPEALADAPLGPETTLAELGLDSLDTIRLVSQVEERFGVQLDEEGLLAVETVGELAGFVDQALQTQAQAPRRSR